MTSEIDICNLALLRLGTRSSISSFTEGSAEASACGKVYALLRDMLLATYQWSFATRRAALADLGNPPDDWAFRYAYPIDCLRVRTIRPSTGQIDIIPFEISGDADAQGNPIKVILCNVPQAELIYTAQLTLTELFPPHFIEALTWMIAAELANALSGDNALAQNALQMAVQSISASKCHDANETSSPQEHLPDWVSVRGFAHADQSYGRGS